jgi:hypothetical protein
MASKARDPHREKETIEMPLVPSSQRAPHPSNKMHSSVALSDHATSQALLVGGAT